MANARKNDGYVYPPGVGAVGSKWSVLIAAKHRALLAQRFVARWRREGLSRDGFERGVAIDETGRPYRLPDVVMRRIGFTGRLPEAKFRMLRDRILTRMQTIDAAMRELQAEMRAYDGWDEHNDEWLTTD